jgi:hypothetical protein
MSLGTTLDSLAIVKAVGWRWPATFVDWMMGWPLQWSALRPLEMDKFREWQRLHSAASRPPSVGKRNTHNAEFSGARAAGDDNQGRRQASAATPG